MNMDIIQAPRTDSCVTLAPGKYSIQSVALPGELVGVGSPFTGVFPLIMEKTPPQGDLGVVGVSI